MRIAYNKICSQHIRAIAVQSSELCINGSYRETFASDGRYPLLGGRVQFHDDA